MSEGKGKQATRSVANERQRRSLRCLARRAGRKNSPQTSKWWAVEGREQGVWTSVIAGETSIKSSALMAVEDLRKTMPHMQWRVVEVVERRTVIRVTRASSPSGADELRGGKGDSE